MASPSQIFIPLCWNQHCDFLYEPTTGIVYQRSTALIFKFTNSLALFHVTIIGNPIYNGLEWTANARIDYDAFISETDRYQQQPITGYEPKHSAVKRPPENDDNKGS